MVLCHFDKFCCLAWIFFIGGRWLRQWKGQLFVIGYKNNVSTCWHWNFYASLELVTKLMQSIFSLISSFLVWFYWFKMWWVHQLGFYKPVYILKAKMQGSNILNYKSKSISICPSTNIEPLYTKHHIFPHFFIYIFFVALEALGWRLQMFFELQKQRNNVWGFDLLWFFNVYFLAIYPKLFTWNNKVMRFESRRGPKKK